jgi:hypothetical protein
VTRRQRTRSEALPGLERVDSQGELWGENAHWAAWTKELNDGYLFPLDQIEVEPARLAVYRDQSRRLPLALVLGDVADPDVAIHQVNRDFEFVVVGDVIDRTVYHLGSYEGEARRVEDLPTWMPAHPRTSPVPKTTKLLPFRNEEDARRAFLACHDALYKATANDPAATFDLMLLAVAAKVLDEGSSLPEYQFACTRGESLTVRASLLGRLLSKAEGWCDQNLGSRLALPPLDGRVATTILRSFQDYSFLLTTDSPDGMDILGTAYEAIVGATFRGELGSYFTPRTIADFVARMVDLREGRVLDPACGSAGLLLAVDRLARNHNTGSVPDTRIECFGNDLNSRMVRTARVNLLLHGLPAENILHGDGLDLPRILDGFVDVSKEPGPWWDLIPSGPFEAVVANPPFAGHESGEDNLLHIESAQRPDGSRRSLNRTLPFLEAIVASLKVRGVAGLVIPTSILNAEEESFVRFRELLLQHIEILAVIGLPERAFVHTDCGIHGALLFLRRVSEPSPDYDIFVDWADQLGYDRLGRFKRENDLPAIVQRYTDKPWPTENTFPLAFLTRGNRWDPAWLRVARSLPPTTGVGGLRYVCLTDLLDVRDARFPRRDILADKLYRYFEVSDVDLETGVIRSIHETSGYELLKKGRIRLQVRRGDLLLPNHRDSLIAKGAPTGRSAVIVSDEHEGLLTTDRFLVFTPTIDSLLLQTILNSAGVRRQIVAQCRGAASLDVRERTLASVLVPRTVIQGPLAQRIVAESKRLTRMRSQSVLRAANLREAIELEFGQSGEFRPAGWGAL